MNLSEACVFDPTRFLAGDYTPTSGTRPSLLILNQPIAQFSIFARLWTHTSYRICADGGANRLYDMFHDEPEAQRIDYLPDAIHGDLDSLRSDVRQYYADHGVDISRDHGQVSTDFGKAMQKITSKSSASPQREILIVGTLAGRVDQGLGILHDMIREESNDSGLRLWLFSESNISFILKSGHNTILKTFSSGLFTDNVGIVPIYGPATITTSGLEWDVKEWETRMGYRVSTSNHVKSDEIRIQTNTPVLFTIERSTVSTSTTAKGT